MDVVGHAIDFHANAADSADDAGDVLVKFVFNGRVDEAAAILRAEYDVIEQLRICSGHDLHPCLKCRRYAAGDFLRLVPWARAHG